MDTQGNSVRTDSVTHLHRQSDFPRFTYWEVTRVELKLQMGWDLPVLASI